MSEENVAILRRLFEGWVQGDYSVGRDTFDPDVAYEFHWGVDHESVKGAEAMTRAFLEMLVAGPSPFGTAGSCESC
jgi:ketosteroid isomerase-like protein